VREIHKEEDGGGEGSQVDEEGRSWGKSIKKRETGGSEQRCFRKKKGVMGNPRGPLGGKRKRKTQIRGRGGPT